MITEFLKFRNPDTNSKINWHTTYIERLPNNPLVVEISDFNKTWQLPLLFEYNGEIYSNDMGNPKYKEFSSEQELYDVYETFFYLETIPAKEWNKWVKMYNGYPLLKGTACIGTRFEDEFRIITHKDLLVRNYESLKWYLINDYLI